MSIDLIDEEKAGLRRSMRALLSDVCDRRALQTGEAIADRLESWSGWIDAATVALFARMPGEVDTSPLIRAAQRSGKRLLFPRTIPGLSLEFILVRDLGSMRTGRHGYREPDAQSPAETIATDVLMLVPGYAFDRHGGRLGRGAGYYDRALGGIRRESGHPKFIGIGFAIQLVDSVPMTPLDVRMDGVVTEAESILGE